MEELVLKDIKNLKDLENKISSKEVVARIKDCFKNIPCDTNNFSKIIKFNDKSFLFDAEKQSELEELIFTDKELEDISREDYINCLLFAYVWVYSFKDYDGKIKTTPKVPNFNFEIKNKDAKELMKSPTNKNALTLVGLQDADLSEWEKALVITEIFTRINNPVVSAMGLSQRL